MPLETEETKPLLDSKSDSPQPSPWKTNPGAMLRKIKQASDIKGPFSSSPIDVKEDDINEFIRVIQLLAAYRPNPQSEIGFLKQFSARVFLKPIIQDAIGNHLLTASWKLWGTYWPEVLGYDAEDQSHKVLRALVSKIHPKLIYKNSPSGCTNEREWGYIRGYHFLRLRDARMQRFFGTPKEMIQFLNQWFPADLPISEITGRDFWIDYLKKAHSHFKRLARPVLGEDRDAINVERKTACRHIEIALARVYLSIAQSDTLRPIATRISESSLPSRYAAWQEGSKLCMKFSTDNTSEDNVLAGLADVQSGLLQNPPQKNSWFRDSEATHYMQQIEENRLLSWVLKMEYHNQNYAIASAYMEVILKDGVNIQTEPNDLRYHQAQYKLALNRLELTLKKREGENRCCLSLLPGYKYQDYLLRQNIYDQVNQVQDLAGETQLKQAQAFIEEVINRNPNDPDSLTRGYFRQDFYKALNQVNYELKKLLKVVAPAVDSYSTSVNPLSL